MLVSYFESPKFHMPSTELCSESVLISSLCFPVTILTAESGTSDVSKINLISKVLQSGYCLQVSENKIIFIKNAEVEIFELEKK